LLVERKPDGLLHLLGLALDPDLLGDELEVVLEAQRLGPGAEAGSGAVGAGVLRLNGLRAEMPGAEPRVLLVDVLGDLPVVPTCDVLRDEPGLLAGAD